MNEISSSVRLIDLLKRVDTMAHNKIGNYIAPGLSSYLVGGGEYGKVRMFNAERLTRDVITPHSHRFGFTSLVLTGVVRNTLYYPVEHYDSELWVKSTIDQVCGEDGLRKYVHTREEKPTRYSCNTIEYGPGGIYSMSADEIHSIEFDAGTAVLFFEGPQVYTQSVMIEPWVDGEVVPTFRTEPWMFAK